MIKINEKTIEKHFRLKKLKVLYIYSIFSYLTYCKGYVSIDEAFNKIPKINKVSKKTLTRWITILKQENLISLKNNVIHVKSKKYLQSDISISKVVILFELKDLESYNNFKNNAIQQIANLLQIRFRYAFDSLSKNSTSLIKTKKIETKLALIKSKQQVGCSISKIKEKLKIETMTISRALKGKTKKQYNSTPWIKGTEARNSYSSLLTDLSKKSKIDIFEALEGKTSRQKNYKWSFDYDVKTDMYKINYAIASVIQVKCKTYIL